MVTHGYDRENAEKFYEYMKYQRANVTLGKSLSISTHPAAIESLRI